MSLMSEKDTTEKIESNGRIDRLSASDKKTKALNQKYSKFIRWMRLVLPVIAIAMMAVVFTWSTGNETIQPIQENLALPKIGKNELLNPHFESQDDKKQPYTITAKRAIRGETNENLVLLEEPLADILLNSGQWLAIKSQNGAFRQDNKRLLLKGAVEIYHDQGYQMNMDLLNVDMNKNDAWTDVDVKGFGPDGHIESKGMQTTSENNLIIFTGPAKLTLTENEKSLFP